jgi:hypothetical protein
MHTANIGIKIQLNDLSQRFYTLTNPEKKEFFALFDYTISYPDSDQYKSNSTRRPAVWDHVIGKLSSLYPYLDDKYRALYQKLSESPDIDIRLKVARNLFDNRLPNALLIELAVKYSRDADPRLRAVIAFGIVRHYNKIPDEVKKILDTLVKDSDSRVRTRLMVTIIYNINSWEWSKKEGLANNYELWRLPDNVKNIPFMMDDGVKAMAAKDFLNAVNDYNEPEGWRENLSQLCKHYNLNVYYDKTIEDLLH